MQEALLGEDRAPQDEPDGDLDKSVADPLYDLALFEMFLEATRNEDFRPQTREWSALIGQSIDRVLPPTDPSVPRDVAVQVIAVQVVAALIDGLMLESASNQELPLPELSEHLRVVIARLLAPTDQARPRG